MEHRQLQEIRIIDWGLLDYDQTLVRQQQLVDERINGHSPDRLVLVEHPPVVTIGRSGNLGDLCITKEELGRMGVSFHRVDRGGRATFHGPGQLVVYPIVKVRGKDIHAFLNRLLDTIADVLRSYQLVPEMKNGKPGLWVNGAKIASVGLAVRKWVTYHGVALNVCTDPGWFDLIFPCGQRDETITSMDHEMGAVVSMSDIKHRLVDRFCSRLGYTAYEKTTDTQRRHPPWLVLPPTNRQAADHMGKGLERFHLATVCESARCPNQGECFARGTATFMILGTRCTRSCRFCAVDKGTPHAPDNREPRRIAMAVRQLGLTHAVITSVTRDDLHDGGAGRFAETVRQIRKQCPGVSVEVLVPDFGGSVPSLDTVCAARPEVFNHNIETVPRLYADVRPMADYRRSLSILSYTASHGMQVKTGLMLGLGETHDEVVKTLQDVKQSGCRAIALGQYLSPSSSHLPVVRYVPPKEFDWWADTARDMGFTSVASGPLVRSSYRAAEMMGPVHHAFGNKHFRKVS